MAIEEKKFLGVVAVEQLIKNTRNEIKTGDEETLAAAKKYAEDLGVNYDPAGTAQTKVDELANGAVKENTDAIAKLNGDDSTEGSVAKAVADAKALIDADVNAVKERVDALESDVGDVETLETTAKNLAAAVNEVRNAISVGGTAAAITLDTATTTEGMAKSYTLKQGDNVVGTIDIPKDMVVESGSVVTLADGDVDGYAAGTYIKLVLANANNDVIYVNVGTLVDIYKAQANATQVQLTIDSSTREISAVIVAESITAAELAADAVTTVKIADGNVTKAKLSASVQASLDKADASASQVALEEEVNRAKEAEAKALTDANTYTDEQVAAEKERAEGIEAGLEERLADVEAQLGTGEGSVDEKIATAKQEAIDAAAEDATTKANTAEQNANTYTNDKVAELKESVDANTEEINALKSVSYVEITAEEINAMFEAEVEV